MPQYLVTWKIDIEDDSPVEAARHARAIQLNPDSIATVFELSTGAENFRVDLNPELGDNPLCERIYLRGGANG